MEKVRQLLRITSENVIPALFNENFITKYKIVENAESIDKSGYSVSNFGSYIRSKGDNIITLDVSMPLISFSSNENDKLIQFFEALKNEFPELVINQISFAKVLHYSEEGIFNTVMQKLAIIKDFEIEQLRLRKDNAIISIHECAQDRLHLQYESSPQIEEKTTISELKFDLHKFIEDSNILFENFSNNYILKT